MKKSSATRWNAAPFALGAMSAAGPGGQASRKILTEPIGCMYLAGEATHETLWGTIDGAWESGERAAEAALRRIGASQGSANRAGPARARSGAHRRRARGPIDVRPSARKALISWSSGKDFAFALHEIRRAGEFDVVGALTTVTETFGRVSIHGVRQEILQKQCEAAGLPQHIVPIPYPCPNEVYEARMGEAVAQAVADGVTHMIFGDLFLADIRAYREQKLAGTGITPVFPLWERPTPELAQAMIASGLEASSPPSI